MAVQEHEREASKRRSPPYPIGPSPARLEAVGQIYGYVASRDLPPSNIALEPIRAYYPGVKARTVKTWAYWVLCMISEYHMACVTRGSPVTSPILPEEIEDQLPPLSSYTCPEDCTGLTDVRVQDNWAKTLWVAV